MALELFQGFDYSSIGDLQAEGFNGPLGAAAVSAAYSRYAGGMGMLLDGTFSPCYVVIQTSGVPAFTASPVKVIGLAINIQTGLSAGVVYPLGFVGTSTNCSVLVNPNGSLSLMDSGGSVLTTSAAGLLTTGIWAYLELKSTGSQVMVAVNGTLACSAPLALGNVNRMDIGSREFSTSATGYKMWIDDFYACNGQGSAQNDWLGTCRVQTLTPTGAGNYSQWTPNGAATDWQCINQITEDGDATYVSDGAAGHRDSYTHAALSGTVNAVLAVDDVMYAKTDPSASGTHTLATSQRIAGADYDNPTRTLTSNYVTYHDLRTTSPATAAAYTSAEINAMEIGLKNVSG